MPSTAPYVASGSKRAAPDSEQTERPGKLPCASDFGDIFKAANESVAVLISRERQKHQAEIVLIQDLHADEIRRLKDAHSNEIKAIGARHASDLERQGASFERELGIRKAGEAEMLAKQKTEIEKASQERIDILSARLDTAERVYRTALSTVESKLTEQDAKNRDVTIKALRTSFDTRVESITHQVQAENKAHVAELVAGYQAREAGLKATIAEKEVQIETFKKCMDAGEELMKTREALSAVPHQVQAALSHMTSLSVQAQLVQNQVQQLQGFISGLQSCAMPPRAAGPPGFWPHAPALQMPVQRHPPRDFGGPQ